MKTSIKIMTALCLLLSMSGCMSSTKQTSKLKQPKALQTVHIKKYDMNLTLDTKQKTLGGKVTMEVKNNTKDTLKELCLRNYAPSIMKSLKWKQGKSELSSAWLTDSKEALALHTKKDPSVVYVDLQGHVLRPKDTLRISLRYQTDIPRKHHRFAYSDNKGKQIYQLSFCFPMLSMYENGAWVESPYIRGAESTYSEVCDYAITLHAPKDYMIAACGDEKTKDGVTTIQAKQMRDMAIMASNYMKVKTETIDGIRVNNYMPIYEELDDYYDVAMQSAKDSLHLYGKHFGAYPYKELDIVHAFSNSYMEYPGLILLGYPDLKRIADIPELIDYTQLASSTAHEVAHQWFYAVVGNDQYKEPWLDESFAEYCEDMLYAHTKTPSYTKAIKLNRKANPHFTGYISEKEFQEHMVLEISQNPFSSKINQPYNTYDISNDEYSSMIYDHGASFLYELRKVMGDKAFFSMMQDYYQTYRFHIVKGQDFLRAIRAYDDSQEVEALIKRYIDESLYQE